MYKELTIKQLKNVLELIENDIQLVRGIETELYKDELVSITVRLNPSEEV